MATKTSAVAGVVDDLVEAVKKRKAAIDKQHKDDAEAIRFAGDKERKAAPLTKEQVRGLIVDCFPAFTDAIAAAAKADAAEELGV